MPRLVEENAIIANPMGEKKAATRFFISKSAIALLIDFSIQELDVFPVMRSPGRNVKGLVREIIVQTPPGFFEKRRKDFNKSFFLS
jgi:hypothetical protein